MRAMEAATFINNVVIESLLFILVVARVVPISINRYVLGLVLHFFYKMMKYASCEFN